MQNYSTNTNERNLDYPLALLEQDAVETTGGSAIAGLAAVTSGKYWLQTKSAQHILFNRLEPCGEWVHLIEPVLLNPSGWLGQAGFEIDTSHGLDIRASEIAAFGRGRG